MLAEKRAPKPDTQERGGTGMLFAGYGARGESASRLTELEYNTNLYGTNGIRTYDRMRLSDPKVAGLRRAQNQPLISAGVRIDPVDPDDAKAVEVADFVTQALVSTGPLSVADHWADNLRQFLLYLDYGYAPFEMVWEMRDGHAIIDRFAYRPPSTVQDIHVAGGRITHVTQVAQAGQTVEIPGEKLLWFCHEREGDNWRGRSLLRPMYKPWFNKEKAEILLLILLEKMGGLPVAREVAGGLTDTERDVIDGALESFHLSDRGYLRTPETVEVRIEGGNISLTEGLELVRYWDQQLSTVSMQQFLDLGSTPNGSRALGATMSDLYLAAMGAIAKQIENTLNAPEGPIHQLVAYNFAASEDVIPTLRFASLGKLDVKALAAGLHQLWQMGMSFSDADWEWIRSELDLPAHEAQNETVAPNETPPAPEPASSDEDEAPSSEVSACECEHALAEGRFWRQPAGPELFVALDEIADALDDAKNVVRDRTAEVRERISADLAKRAVAAAESGDPDKVAALASGKAPMLDTLARELRAIFGEYFDAGRAQVRDELARQRDGEPVAAEIVGERSGDDLAMADLPPRMTTKEARRFYAMLDAEAEIAARAIGSSAVSSAAKSAAAMLGAPPSREVAAEMIRRATAEEAIRIGWTVTRVMIGGRSAEAMEEREQIAYAQYSAILDGNVCENCEPRDGETTEDLDEATGWTPNPECLGGDRCRCATIYIYKAGDE